MKRLLPLLSLLLCSACAMLPQVRNTSLLATEEDAIPTLVGHASSTTWFWLWTTGDASVEKAKENGGIKNITSITQTSDSFLGFIETKETTVRGD